MMKNRSLQLGLLIFRTGPAAMMLTHGIPKLMSFQERADSFPDPLGVGSPLSLSLAILGELICPVLIIAGLLTRLAALPALITMLVAALVVHGSHPFAKQELALLRETWRKAEAVPIAPMRQATRRWRNGSPSRRLGNQTGSTKPWRSPKAQ